MRIALRTGIILFLCAFYLIGLAQTDQTVQNGEKTSPINVPASACGYEWFNNTPGIGLPAKGTGNIPAFTAINNSNVPVTATITAKPVSAGFAYIPVIATGTVSVINLQNNSTVATIPVGTNPLGVSISPDGSKVYITSQGSNSISVINTATNKVIATITAAFGSYPSGVVVSPDGAHVYYTNYQLNSISIISTATNSITSTINVGGNPYGITISPDGKYVYVSNSNDGTISVINTATNLVEHTVTVGTAPNGLCLSPDGSKLYVANYSTNNISVINTSDNTVIATIDIGTPPFDVSISPDGNTLYVSDPINNAVSTINTSSFKQTGSITGVNNPFGMSLNPDGSILYVASSGSKLVTTINTQTGSVSGTIALPSLALSIGNFVSGGPGCNSGPITFKITVNSSPTPVVTTSTITGSIIGCVGSPGESPNVGKFTVAGTSLSGDITVTPPPGFDLSLTAIGGYSTSLTLKQIGGTVINRDIYIRSSATDPVGPISGNIQLTTPGVTADVVPVTGLVNALPTINPVGNVSYNNGAATTPINFSGTGNTYNWTNDIPGIGLPASGTGNISSFAAIDVDGDTPVTATITVTPVSSSTSCPGNPTIFTITVNPNSAPPGITTGPVSGTISACLGAASESPNIQQFTVSGSNLTGDITATAPTGFEISLAQGSGFGNTLTIPQSAGIVSNVNVYVRSAAADPAGSISGNVTLTSQGAASQNLAVSGTVNALPLVNPVASQTKSNGAPTDPINFTGAGADTYIWTNDIPGIGLAASGTGNIPSFNAVDVNGDTPATATLTVTPVNAVTGCTGTPVTFTITVNPAAAPVITTTGTLTGLSTIYGTASSSESFTVSAGNATAGILVTAPQGFELSTDNNTFSATVTAGQAGAITNAPVYIRLAATTPVNNYSGDVVLSTTGATDVNVNMPVSAVERATLTVTAPDAIRAFGVPNPVFVPQYLGFVNGENQSVLAILPQLTTIATTASAVGKYPIHVSGGSALNYTIFPVDGTLTIVPAPSEIVVPNAFTPNGDGVNDFWNIKALVDFPQCIVSIYSRYGNLVFQSRGYGKPWDGTQNGAPVPTGTYYYVIDPNEAGLQLLSGYVAVLR